MTRKTTNLHSYAVTQKIANAGVGSNNNNVEDNEAIATKNADDGHVVDEGGGGRGGGTIDNDGVTTAVALQTLTRSHDLQHHHHHHHHHVLPLTRDIGSTTTSSSSAPATAAALMKFKNDCSKENIPNNTTILLQVAAAGPAPTVAEGTQLFSSDTNEEFEIIGGDREVSNRDIKDIIKNCARNTDHDFYSKRSASNSLLRKFPIENHQLHYFMDTSEESMGTEYVQHTSSLDSSSLPSVMENIELHTENARTFEIKSENLSQAQVNNIKQENFSMTEMPSTSSERNNSQQIQNPTSTSSAPMPATTMARGEEGGSCNNKMSERDKYYRHKRRFNRRLEKRFDALLNVVGQVVKAEYPSVDVKPLMDTVASLATNVGQILSSESEETDDDNDGEETVSADSDGCGGGDMKTRQTRPPIKGKKK
uniref:Uncharacterized protein n=1 Tax=Musca domestica TaxID=7370 RepID=T1P7T6_MUSDO